MKNLKTKTFNFQTHLQVGSRVVAYWCVRDFDSSFIWPAYETYVLFVVLVIPAFVMAVAYTLICTHLKSMAAVRSQMNELS